MNYTVVLEALTNVGVEVTAEYIWLPWPNIRQIIMQMLTLGRSSFRIGSYHSVQRVFMPPSVNYILYQSV